MSLLADNLIPAEDRPFGNYDLVSKLADGGMAEIFLARRVGDGGLVVIKRILPHLQNEPRFVAMFQDEGRLAEKLLHANLCRVFGAGSISGRNYIEMEYLHGVSLSRILVRAARTEQPLEIGMAVEIAKQCCLGLHYAHELRADDDTLVDVVHRDVSPPNIFVTTQGVAKMLDFGVAKARGATQRTHTGIVKGKDAYMSPEQVSGGSVDRRSDVFSLGTVLWEVLAAKRLFNRDTEFLICKAIVDCDIPDIRSFRPEVSEEIAEVLGKALAQDRDQRYATALEFHDALGAALGEAPASQEELAAFVESAFSDELGTREELEKSVLSLLEAADPLADTDPNEGMDAAAAELRSSTVEPEPPLATSTGAKAEPATSAASSRRPILVVAIFVLGCLGAAIALSLS